MSGIGMMLLSLVERHH